MNYVNNFDEDSYGKNFYLEVLEDAGTTEQNYSKSEPDLEKMVYKDLRNDRRETVESDVEEFTTNHLGDDAGLMGQEGIMTGLQKEKCLSLDRLNVETNLEEIECLHSKTNEEYFNICSLEGNVGYKDDDVGNSHLESVAFSRKTKEMKSKGIGKIGPVNSGKKGKLNEIPRRKHDAKHLTSKEEHFVHDGNSSSASSFNSPDETRFRIDVEDQNNEADVLFLKLKSIGKLSLTDKSEIFDLPNDSCVSLNSSSPEDPELKTKKEDACQRQNDDNTSSLPSMNNQSKNIKCKINILQVPELHFDEVTDTESPINEKQENTLKENKTSQKIDEPIRLSIPKEVRKSEIGRLKVKNRMAGKITQGAERQGAEDESMSKKEVRIVQKDKSTFNRLKTQENSETQVKENESAKILVKRSETSKRELRMNFEEDHLSSSVLDHVDARSVDVMTSPSCHNLPSLSGESSYNESLFRVNTAEPPYERIPTFQEFERQNLAERKDVKNQFRLKIAEAKKMLLEARLTAQEKTAAKRFNEALKKHTELKLKRAFMKADSLPKSATPTLDAGRSSSVVAVKKTFKDVSLSVLSAGFSNIQEIRKAEADFDRAKVKQFQTKMKLQKKKNFSKASTDPQVKKLKSVKKKDTERLERYEVEKMISELRSLNMIDYADKLSQAMASKDEYEAKLRHKLNQEKKLAAQLARKQKLDELARIREEEKRKKMAEKERLEQERKKREALEIAKRQAEAIKRREHNLKLQESLNYTLLATDKSRSFTYSYLPKLKTNPPAQVEKNDRERLRKVKAKYLQGI